MGDKPKRFHDRTSCSLCSSEEDAMNAVALDAERMVKAAALPVEPGETIKAQMNRAARNLRYPSGDWRVRAAWYREAGCWGAAAFRDLQERYAAFRSRQDARTRSKQSDAIAALSALREAYANADPEFFSDQIRAIERAFDEAGCGLSEMVAGVVPAGAPSGQD